MGDLAAFYEDLARFQWWRRRLTNARAGEGLEMHKALGAPVGDGPAAGLAGMHDWLWARLEPRRPARLLDVGCGFGATVLHWAERHASGRFVGLTLSPLQARIAQREAKRRGVGERCEFHVRSFDDALEGEFDVIASVESLFHAPDLARTIAHLASSLAEGGTLLVVEDMARDDTVAQVNDATALLSLWRTAHLHAADDYRKALADADLEVVEDVDLTGQVRHRPPEDTEQATARLFRWRRCLPFAVARHVIDAFRGGLALERLYARGAMEYRLLIARRAGGAR